MKKISLLTVFILLFVYNMNAQTWKSIPKIQYNWVQPRQFIINPYLNDLWLIDDLKIAVIKNDGTVYSFDESEGTFGNSFFAFNELTFAFTPSHTYFSERAHGLYTFDNYTKNLLYPHYDVQSITSNRDTVYVINNNGGTEGFYKYCNGNLITTNLYVLGIVAKNNFIYADLSVPAQVTGPNQGNIVLMHTDPQYAGGPKYEMKFTRKTDSLYVCGAKGISIAYNYDFLDTIAPNNSVNMPSRNVREIEFDHLDRLWAVFNDASNKAFALAMYENGTWTNRYDASNSPIDFSTYRGFEIDTLGNIWVVDNTKLHTLLTPSSPQWLSVMEIEKEIFTELFPNPSSGEVSISSSENMEAIQVYDYMGRTVFEQKISGMKKQDVNLSFLGKGNYIVETRSGSGNSRSKLVLLK